MTSAAPLLEIGPGLAQLVCGHRDPARRRGPGLLGLRDVIGGAGSGVSQILQLLFKVVDFSAPNLESVAGVREAALLLLGSLFGANDGGLRFAHRLRGSRLGARSTLSVDLVTPGGRRCFRRRGWRNRRDRQSRRPRTGRDSSDRIGHIDRAEPGIAQGDRQPARPDGLAGIRVGKRRLECLLQLTTDRLTDDLSPVTSQAAGIMAERADNLAALARQAPQVVRIELRVSSASRLPQLEQLEKVLVSVAHEEVGEPRARRRPAETLDSSGKLSIAGLPGLRHPSLASRGELAGVSPYNSSATASRSTAAILAEIATPASTSRYRYQVRHRVLRSR